MKDNAHQMKLSQLRIFIAVAEQGNFSEAALQLEMSQSAVSHAIAALEKQLGVLLFARGHYGAHLTPVGASIVEHAREIVDRVEEISKAANVAKGLHGGQVRIASFRSVATHILPRVITQFYQRFPAIAVHLTEHDDYARVEQMLREGFADIGFTLLPASEDMEVWEVLQDEFVALFPPMFQLAQPQLTWKELTAYPLVMPPREDVMMQQVYAHCQALGQNLRVAYEMETDATIVSLVSGGLGATILPRLAAQPIPEGVQVYSLPDPLFRVIGAAVFADALQVPAVFAFLDILKSNIPKSEISKNDRLS